MSTTPAIDMAERFRALHAGDGPLLLVNVWDPMSARAAVAGGATALGTTSFGVALDHGVGDGDVGFDDVVELVGRIAGAVDVPVTADIEAGHGSSPDAVGDAVRAVIDRGAAGVNIEDRDV